MTYDPHVWLVYSNEHSAWWRPNAAGYCTSPLDAGRYTLEEATEHCNTRSRLPDGEPPEMMRLAKDVIPGLAAEEEAARVRTIMVDLYAMAIDYCRDKGWAKHPTIDAAHAYLYPPKP